MTVRTKRKVVFDLESNGFLFGCDKIHCIVANNLIDKELISFFPQNIQEGINYLKESSIIIGHSICQFDIPLIEKLYGINLMDYCTIRDTLCMSRMFRPNRILHSLESYGIEYGVPKPVHEDWTTYSPEMLNRCTEDVRINTILYDDLVKEFCRDWDWIQALEIEQKFSYNQSQQELQGVDIDIDLCHKILIDIDKEVNELDSLIKPILPKRIVKKGESIMKPFKKDGTYSMAVTNWLEKI